MYKRWECLMCNKLSMNIEVKVQVARIWFKIKNWGFASWTCPFMCICIPLKLSTLCEQKARCLVHTSIYLLCNFFYIVWMTNDAFNSFYVFFSCGVRVTNNAPNSIYAFYEWHARGYFSTLFKWLILWVTNDIWLVNNE